MRTAWIFFLIVVLLAAAPAVAQPLSTPGDGDKASRPSDQGGGGRPSEAGNSPVAGGGDHAPDAAEQQSSPLYAPEGALAAAKSGEAVSLSSILPDIEARAHGELIDAKLIEIQNILVYALKVLRADGRVTTEFYYARSGIFIGSEPGS